MRRRIGLLTAAALGANVLIATVSVPGAHATSITVNTALDIAPNGSGNFPSDGLCSLRAAIRSAQNNSNAHDVDCATGLGGGVKDIIFIAPSLAGSTMTLTWNPGTGVQPFDPIYDQTNPLEIIGPSTNPADFVISGGNSVRPFAVGYGTIVRGDLKLANLTVRDGNGQSNGSGNPGVNGMGGAFFLAADGAGIGSHLTLDNVVVRNNTASTRGGAIYGDASTITNNGGAYISNSSGHGGALAIDSGPFVLNGYAVLFEGNSATNNGGVIYTNPGNAAPLVHLERSLIKSNTAATGGVLYIDSGTTSGLVFRLQDSTLNANSSVFFAVSSNQSYEYLRNTFVSTGQIFRAGRGFTANSIITGTNTCTNTTTATLHTSSRNLIDGSGCTILNSSNLGAVTGLSASLAQNGGPSVQQTYALSATSNAVDNGDAAYCGTVDARSVTRGINGAGAAGSPQAGDCDIGAYEYAKYVVNFLTGVSQTDEGVNAPIPVRLRMLDPGETSLASPVTVNIALASGSTARIGPSLTHDDVDVPGNSVTFPAGSVDGATAYLQVNVHQDAIAERFGETARIELVPGGTAGVAIAEPRIHELGIRDDDQAGVIVAESGGSTIVAEGSPTVFDTITVRLQSQPDYEQPDPADPYSYGPPANVTLRVTPDRDCTVRSGGVTGTAASPLTALILNANWQSGINLEVLPVDDSYDEDLRDESAPHQCELRYTFTSLDPVYAATQDASTVTVFDNDTAGVTVASTAGSQPLVEGATGITYSVQLNSSPDPGKPLPGTPRGATRVDVTPNPECDAGAGGGATRTLDFTAANWNVPQSVTVSATQDLKVELLHNCLTTTSVSSPDPIYADLSALPTFAGTPRVLDLQIQDYDPPTVTDDPPFVDVTIGGLVVNEGAPSPGQIAVVLRRAPVGADVTVSIATPSDPTIAGPQLTVKTGAQAPASSTQLVFTPTNWSTPQHVSVAAINDDFDEADTHAGTLQFSMASTAPGFNNPALRSIVIDSSSRGNTATQPISIGDNDTSEVLLTAAGGSLAPIEGGANATLQVRLTTHPYALVDVVLTAGPECRLDGAPNRTITIAATNWAATVPVTVSAVDDPLVESSPHACPIRAEVVSTDSLYDVLNYDRTASIVDNDVAGIAVSTAALPTATEGGSGASVVAVLLGQPDGPVEVRFANASGQVANAALTFTSSDWNTPQEVVLGAVDDLVDEVSPGATAVVISLSTSASGFSSPLITVNGSTVAAFNVDVVDNDTAALTADVVSLVGLDEAGTSHSSTTYLATQPTAAVQVDVTATGLCSAAPSTFTLDATSWSAGLAIAITPLTDDTVHAQACSVHLTTTSTDSFNNGLTLTLGGPVADDDVASIVVNAGTIEVAEHSPTTQSYTVVLTSAPTDSVVVTAVADPQLEVTTPPLMFTSRNWNVPQTVTLRAVDDATPEPTTHPGVVTHTVVTGAVEYGAATAAAVNAAIRDNDTTLQLTVSPSPSNNGVRTTARATVSGGDGPAGGTIVFRIDGTDLGAPIAVVDGEAAIDLGMLSRGTYAVSAHYSGDATHAPSSATTTQIVTAVPVAADDSATIAEDSGEATISVRSNDTDADGDGLSIVSHGAAGHGTVTCDTQACRYTPNADFSSTDTFTYEISDGTLRDSATVTITVTPVNDPPVPPVHATFAVPGGGPIMFDLLGGVTDVDGDLLVLLSYEQPAHGTVACTTAGRCTYTPTPGYTGPDSFDYVVSDGTAAPGFGRNAARLQATAIARFDVTAAPALTTDGAEGQAPGGSAGTDNAQPGGSNAAGNAQPGGSGATGSGSGSSAGTSPARTGGPGLAYTGAETVAKLPVAALLIALGGVFLVLGRRRRFHKR